MPPIHSSLPWLDLLPDFLSPWRKTALKKHKAEADVSDRSDLDNEIESDTDPQLFKRLAYDVRNRVKAGHGETCFIAKAWEVQGKIGLEDLSIAYVSVLAI